MGAMSGEARQSITALALVLALTGVAPARAETTGTAPSPTSTDPAVKDLAAQMTPAIMKSVPNIIERAETAITALPQPRDPASLSESERHKVSHLLRTDIVRR
jgi:hypothetical protein